MSESALLFELVKNEFVLRNKVRPTVSEAILWMLTELAEVAEIQLALGAWVRNNPETKPDYDLNKLSEELGDVIYMALVTGMVAEVDPLQSLENKLKMHILATMRAKQ